MAEAPPEPSPTAPASARSIFAVPSPIRRLFNHFPLRTTPSNALPARCAIASSDGTPILFVFTGEEGAKRGGPSFNPACLKWQTYLHMTGVSFRIRPSSNHASPSGALPFLLTPGGALPSSKLESHAAQAGHPRPAPTQTHLALLDSALRPAYLHALYLNPLNTPLLTSLYVPEHAYPVRKSLLASLRSAAEEEVLSSTRSPFANAETLYADAEEALSALEDLIDGKEWFFGDPTLFDASVFAYTNFLLEDQFVWGDERLRGLTRAFPNLVAHRERILEKYWPGELER